MNFYMLEYLKKVFFFVTLLLIFASQGQAAEFDGLIIDSVAVEGNKYVKQEAITKRLPYKVGDVFDSKKRSQAINNVYGLGNFSQVRIDGEAIDDKHMHLFVVVQEKSFSKKWCLRATSRSKQKSLKKN